MDVVYAFRKRIFYIVLGVLVVFLVEINICKNFVKAQATFSDSSILIQNEDLTEEERNAIYFRKITFTQVGVKVIPETPFRENLVNNAEVIYRYGFRVVCETADYQMQNVYFAGVEYTGPVLGNKGTVIDSSGVGYVEVDVRGAHTFTVACLLKNNKVFAETGKSNSVTITPSSVGAKYEKMFYCTAYITASEKDYSEAKVSAAGITDAVFRKDFLAAVKLNGSGISDAGKYISYSSTTGKYFYGEPTTAIGTRATVGTTIAVDPYYIPRAKVGGVWKRATVDVDGLGLRVAEDGGSAITGYHIDVYMGTGQKALAGWSNKNREVTLKSIK